MNDRNFGRYKWVEIVIYVVPVLIIIQVARIKINPQQVATLIDEGQSASGEYHTVVPIRGKIYDRWGHLYAGNQMVYEIGVELQNVKNPETIAQTLNLVIGLDYTEVLHAASITPSKQAVYARVANFITQEKVDQLKALMKQMDQTYGRSKKNNPPSLQGLVFVPHMERIYPEKEHASNVLGFVSREGKGFFGIEGHYDLLMAGEPKTIWVSLDPNRAEDLPDVPDGASVALTIDRAVQQRMEEIIDDAVKANGAESGTIVIINPQTGELMAMATTPRLDINQFWDYSKVFVGETPFNRAISQAIEPGSVFKILTMASALDTGAVQPDTEFVDTGVFEIGGTRIYNWNMGAWGPQDMQGCLQHSLNVCLAWVATQVGPKDFYTYMKAFGIGRSTGIDLDGEVSGRLKSPGDYDWYDADLGTNAFGQGVAVTPIQMVVAASAIANDGKMMAPRIVRSFINEGYQSDIEPRVIGTPIKKETANTLTHMLANSLEIESSNALVPGYRVAGKTGTAEIPTPQGYTTNETNASFIGWGPVDDPQFLVYVWLERPKSSPWGSEVAAPVFKQAVEDLVVLIELPPDKIRKQLMNEK